MRENGCTLKRFKKAADKLTPEQAAALEAWKASEPVRPTTAKPKNRRADTALILLFVIMAIIVLVFSLFRVLVGGMLGDAQLVEQWLILTFLLPVAVMVCGVVIIAGVDLTYGYLYLKRLRSSGWEAYERELTTWHLTADQDFRALAKTIPEVHSALNWRVYDGRLKWDPDDSSSAKEESVQPAALVTDDPELDELERQLNSAKPGPKHSIVIPSARVFKREAKRLAKEKTLRLADNHRFIAEASVSTTRPLAVNSAGWLQTVPTTQAEKDAVRREVEHYFTTYGLKVLGVTVVFSGMYSGTRGSHQNMRIVVRVE